MEAIYRLEEAGGQPLLVLELVEGEDLADRVRRGAIPLRASLALARQIAQALEVAHERGIVHRDLKPAYVRLAPDGCVKVLDFGLAKAYGGDTVAASVSASQSPTLACMGTQARIILGTVGGRQPSRSRDISRIAGKVDAVRWPRG